MSNKAFDYGKIANELNERSKQDNALIVGSEIRQAIHESFEVGQRQGMERAAEIVKKNKVTFGINEYCFDYIFEDLSKEIKP